MKEQLAQTNAAIADLIVDRHMKTGSATSSSKKSSGSDKRSAKYIDPTDLYNDPKFDEVAFSVWIRRLDNKLDANSDHWDTERLRLGYVEGKLKGKISDSLSPYLEEQLPDRITTVEQLKAWLTSECDDPNKKSWLKRSTRTS